MSKLKSQMSIERQKEIYDLIYWEWYQNHRGNGMGNMLQTRKFMIQFLGFQFLKNDFYGNKFYQAQTFILMRSPLVIQV